MSRFQGADVYQGRTRCSSFAEGKKPQAFVRVISQLLLPSVPEMKGTIKSSDEISRLFKEGRRINTASMLALISEGSTFPDKAHADQNSRVAIIAGKRLGNAPQRNRAKRRIREALRQAQPLPQGREVVLVVREAILNLDFTKIVKDMDTITACMTKSVGKGIKR